MVIVVLILVVLLVIASAKALKWKMRMKVLVYFMEKNQYRQPNKKEMEECTGYVVKNVVKGLTGR